MTETSGAVDIADSFLLTSVDSFLPDMMVLDFLLVLACSTVRRLLDIVVVVVVTVVASLRLRAVKCCGRTGSEVAHHHHHPLLYVATHFLIGRQAHSQQPRIIDKVVFVFVSR